MNLYQLTNGSKTEHVPALSIAEPAENGDHGAKVKKEVKERNDKLTASNKSEKKEKKSKSDCVKNPAKSKNKKDRDGKSEKYREGEKNAPRTVTHDEEGKRPAKSKGKPKKKNNSAATIASTAVEKKTRDHGAKVKKEVKERNDKLTASNKSEKKEKKSKSDCVKNPAKSKNKKDRDGKSEKYREGEKNAPRTVTHDEEGKRPAKSKGKPKKKNNSAATIASTAVEKKTRDHGAKVKKEVKERNDTPTASNKSEKKEKKSKSDCVKNPAKSKNKKDRDGKSEKYREGEKNAPRTVTHDEEGKRPAKSKGEPKKKNNSAATIASTAVDKKTRRKQNCYTEKGKERQMVPREQQVSQKVQSSNCGLGIISIEDEMSIISQSSMGQKSVQSLQPGAVAVAGIGQPNGDVEGLAVSSRAQTILEEPSPSELLINAVLVVENRTNNSIPIVTAIADLPWYKRKIFKGYRGMVCFCLGVLTIVLTLVFTLRISDGPTTFVPITMVVQLDDYPGETGWTLTCAGEVVSDVNPGTYHFLPIPAWIPFFRIILSVTVPLGETCSLTLLHSEINALKEGFYEVYYGEDVTDSDAIILKPQIFLTDIQTEDIFLVAPPAKLTMPPSSSLRPTATSGPASVSIAPAPTALYTCSICPDGAPFPQDFGKKLLNSSTGETCGDLEVQAVSVDSNSSECSDLKQYGAADCGCKNHCESICPDGSPLNPAFNDELVSIVGRSKQYCADLQRLIKKRDSSLDECRSANYFGEEVCGCEPTEEFCRICEDGSVPPSEFIDKEILPGVACSDISGFGYEIRISDSRNRFSRVCPACWAIGTYCGCPSVENGNKYCRLCGPNNNNTLPDLDRIVYSRVLKKHTTCLEIEFQSNFNDTNVSDCAEFQKDSSTDCCI